MDVLRSRIGRLLDRACEDPCRLLWSREHQQERMHTFMQRRTLCVINSEFWRARQQVSTRGSGDALGLTICLVLLLDLLPAAPLARHLPSCVLIHRLARRRVRVAPLARVVRIGPWPRVVPQRHGRWWSPVRARGPGLAPVGADSHRSQNVVLHPVVPREPAHHVPVTLLPHTVHLRLQLSEVADGGLPRLL
jgi:hypothetical protein